jgi:hypothetical protein
MSGALREKGAEGPGEVVAAFAPPPRRQRQLRHRPGFRSRAIASKSSVIGAACAPEGGWGVPGAPGSLETRRRDVDAIALGSDASDR